MRRGSARDPHLLQSLPVYILHIHYDIIYKSKHYEYESVVANIRALLDSSGNDLMI
jgi:hypothetical protein